MHYHLANGWDYTWLGSLRPHTFAIACIHSLGVYLHLSLLMVFGVYDGFIKHLATKSCILSTMPNTSSMATHTDTPHLCVFRADFTCVWVRIRVGVRYVASVWVYECVRVSVCVCVFVRGSALNGNPGANGLGYISTWTARVFRQQHVYRYSFAYLLDTHRRSSTRRCVFLATSALIWVRNSKFE